MGCTRETGSVSHHMFTLCTLYYLAYYFQAAAIQATHFLSLDFSLWQVLVDLIIGNTITPWLKQNKKYGKQWATKKKQQPQQQQNKSHSTLQVLQEMLHVDHS